MCAPGTNIHWCHSRSRSKPCGAGNKPPGKSKAPRRISMHMLAFTHVLHSRVPHTAMECFPRQQAQHRCCGDTYRIRVQEVVCNASASRQTLDGIRRCPIHSAVTRSQLVCNDCDAHVRRALNNRRPMYHIQLYHVAYMYATDWLQPGEPHAEVSYGIVHTEASYSATTRAITRSVTGL